MHTVFALLCFVVVIHWLIFPYPSGLLHWHCGNLMIAPVPAKQPWWIWINTSCEFIMNDCITTTKQSTTKLCAYFLGYTVSRLHHINNAMSLPCLLPSYTLPSNSIMDVTDTLYCLHWYGIRFVLKKIGLSRLAHTHTHIYIYICSVVSLRDWWIISKVLTTHTL